MKNSRFGPSFLASLALVGTSLCGEPNNVTRGWLNDQKLSLMELQHELEVVFL